MQKKAESNMLYEGSGIALVASLDKLAYPVVISMPTGHSIECVHLNNYAEVTPVLRDMIAEEKKMRVFRAK